MNNYAPIIIPTLNRYEHLRECIESLAKNRYATQTNLHISLDYPPSEKYMEGYLKCKEYLSESIEGFNNVYIYYQTENLGAYKNVDFLIDKALEESDRYILSEDDNVFSPNFLEYVNKGLDLFEDDERIVGVSGYCQNVPPNIDVSENNIWLDYNFAAWGIGTWATKEKAMREAISRERFDELLRDKNLCGRLYKDYPDRYWQVVEALVRDPYDRTNCFVDTDGNIAAIDYLRGVYMAVNNYYCVRPTISKARNCGFNDGSGLHCNGADYDFDTQEIDGRCDFNYLYQEDMDGLVNAVKLKRDYQTYRARFLRRVYMLFGVEFARKCFNLEYKLARLFK